MRRYKALASNASKFNKLLKKIEKIEKALEQAKEETEREAPKRAAKEVDYICWSVITNWYDSYFPHVYDRTFSLLNSYHITPGHGYLNFKLNADELSGHRADNGYIFDLTMVHGWHGGALSGDEHPNPGNAYWRYPIPEYYQWYPTAAPRSFSPLDRIMEEIRAFDFQNMTQELFKNYYRKYRGRK